MPTPWRWPGGGFCICRVGKVFGQFCSGWATYSARAVKNGRPMTSQLNAKDAINPQAQQRKGFYAGKRENDLLKLEKP